MRRLVVPRLLAVILLSACGAAQTVPVAAPPAATAALVTRLAFGSCNRESLPQPLWSLIAARQPDVWIWLGDNIYGDSDDMDVLRRKYAQQLSNPSYREFIAKVPVIGTWDDHDFGKGDGGREFNARAGSQQEMLNFLGEPPGTPRRKQEGVYASYTYGPAGKQIKVILLDTRYHRDSIGSNGTMLGETQWAWLERELRDSKAQIHLIGSGIQVIAAQHRYEKWANFPAERERLFRLIGDLKVPGVIFLSGDRHIAELSLIEWGPVGYPLYDLTSSGLTHTWPRRDVKEQNDNRVSEMVVALNYGIIDVDWNERDPLITMRVHDATDAVRIEKKIRLSSLR
jgi:alkaline phosphatase D